MNKIWINSGEGEKIIAFIGDILYKINPPDEQVGGVVGDLKRGVIPEENTFGLPLAYIKEIRWQEGLGYFQVFFRESEEHYRIGDENLLMEIFDFCKTVMNSSKYELEANGRLWVARKPLFVLLVVLMVAVVTEYIRVEVERDGEIRSWGVLSGLSTLIASLGLLRELLIFIVLAAIAIVAVIRKMKTPPVLHRIRVFSKSRLEYY